MKKFNIKNFFRKNLNLFDQENSEKNPKKFLTQKDQPTPQQKKVFDNENDDSWSGIFNLGKYSKTTDRTVENKKEIFKKNIREASKKSEDAKNFHSSDKSFKDKGMLHPDLLCVFAEKGNLGPSGDFGEKSEELCVIEGKKTRRPSSKSFQENSGESSLKSVLRRSISNGSCESQIEENLNNAYGGYQLKQCRLSKFNPINHPENSLRDESPSILDPSNKEEMSNIQNRTPKEDPEEES
jgi:hypothetical protein